MLGLALCGCDRQEDEGSKDSQNLNATAKIAAEIQLAHQFECHPHLQLDDNIAGIEMNIDDPDMNYQAVVAEVAKLKSVQSFEGTLHLTIVHRNKVDDAGEPNLWIKFDAKTGKQLMAQ